MVTIDFETEAITGAGKPPKPVGVAIKVAGGKGKYMAWGHPVGNNCTVEEAGYVLKGLWGGPCLFHNAAFDLSVAQAHFGLPTPCFHDTLFTLFLVDPHADTLSLKPAAEKYLGLPPDEQNAVRNWLIEHGIVRANQKDWGAFIARAPGDLVGKYAIGDVDRTYALHKKLQPTLDARMLEAYQREIALLPILMENERIGMRLDTGRLTKDIKIYEGALTTADAWIRKKLKAKDLNLDSPADVAMALKASVIVKEFKKTPTGKDSTSRKNLTLDMFTDPAAYWALGYRGRLETVLANSMRPWLSDVDGNGMIHTSWNQVRSTDTGGFKGTRTGRLSCSRFMNIAKAWEGFQQPKQFPALPLVRRYILPDKGQVIYHRDYRSQEFRVLAHFEDDQLMQEFQSNPDTDYHTKVQEMILKSTGQVISRQMAKILNFGVLYGMGAGLLAEKLGVSVEEAHRLRRAQKAATPGVTALDASLKALGRAGEPIRTWGGRRYFCEPPKLVDGQMRGFEYKLINYLVQGSSADMTKEALIRYHQHPRREGRLLVTVHDEVNVSARTPHETAILKECMESIEFDVPMLTEGKSGSNWGDLK